MSDVLEIERPIQDAELIAVLREAHAEEIDVLIDVITDFGKGRLALDAATKRELVSARHATGDDRYGEAQLSLLSEEIRQFGGHSASNLARRLLSRPALPYREIVEDVYTKLGGSPLNAPTLADKERAITLGLFGPEWRELTARERHKRCTSPTVLSGRFRLAHDAGPGLSARELVAAGIAGVIRTGRPLVQPLARPLAQPPALPLVRPSVRPAPQAPVAGAVRTPAPLPASVGPASINGVAAPGITAPGVTAHACLKEAYRITIPCVAQLGWIRLRREAEALASAPVADTAAENPETADSSPLSVELKQESGATLMRLTAFDGPADDADAASLSPEHIASFNALLSILPDAAALQELKRGQYVRCSLPIDALPPAKGSEDSFRAWLSEAGRIREHATLSGADALEQILVSTATWNLLSSAVGQKHLDDINEKLVAIRRQLDDVQEDLEALRRDELRGLVDYVQSLLTRLEVDGLNGLARVTLEHRLSDMARLEAWFQERREAELKSLATLETDPMYRSGAASSGLHDSLHRAGNWIHGELQVIQLRVISLALLNQVLPQARYLNEARNRLEKLKQLAGTLPEQYWQIYHSKLALSNSVVNEISDDETQQLEDRLTDLAITIEQADRETVRLHRALFGRADREVLLQLDDGMIRTARWLDCAEAA